MGQHLGVGERVMLCIGAPPGPQQDFLSAPSFTAPLNQDLDCGHRYFLHKQRHVLERKWNNSYRDHFL